MREQTGWIKLNRNITEWRWFRNPITLAVWVHLLVRANYKDVQIGHDTVQRGEVYLTQDMLATEIGITRKQLRTALEHLSETGEIRATKKIGKVVVISIPNYDAYQSEGPRKGHERATKGPDIKKDKKDKNTLSLTPSLKPYHVPTLDEVREYERTSGSGKDPEVFYKTYSEAGWRANDKKVYNWQRLYDNWQEPEKVVKPPQETPKSFTDEDGYTYEWCDGKYEVVRKGKR